MVHDTLPLPRLRVDWHDLTDLNIETPSASRCAACSLYPCQATPVSACVRTAIFVPSTRCTPEAALAQAAEAHDGSQNTKTGCLWTKRLFKFEIRLKPNCSPRLSGLCSKSLEASMAGAYTSRHLQSKGHIHNPSTAPMRYSTVPHTYGGELELLLRLKKTDTASNGRQSCLLPQSEW